MKPSVKIILTFVLALIALPYLVLVFMYNAHLDVIQSRLDYSPKLPTTVYDANGLIISELYDEMREPVTFEQIPESVIAAFTSAEDKNFYKHNGLDYPGMLRALIIDIQAGSVKQGGSTITQQLIKQLYTSRQRTISRKIIEILLVRKIEESYTKDQILEMYLNQIYFGHGVYGIKAATHFFFDKELEEITIYEASLLSLIPPAPNRYSPLKNPRKTYDKHRQIVLNLIKNGHLAKARASKEFELFWEEYRSHIQSRYPSEIARSTRFDKAPYVTDYVRQLLIEEFGEDAVYRGGLQVYTTIDLRMQASAKKHLARQIEKQRPIARSYNRALLQKLEKSVYNNVNAHETERLLHELRETYLDTSELLFLTSGGDSLAHKYNSYARFYRLLRWKAEVEGAFVALEPDTGKIRALVGGSGFSYENQLNRAVAARRQPGSSFKPFAYAAGIDAKLITAANSFDDLPLVFNQLTKTWAPQNATKKFSGTVLVRKAITRSVNTIAVLAYEIIGGENIAACASRMIGIAKDRFTIDPTLALGSSELTPLELATGFACFANQGRRVEPYIIEKIETSGKQMVKKHELSGVSQAISKSTAFIMNSILQEVVNAGTATLAVRSRGGFYETAAGKTGTNSEYRDAWFAGYTPDLTAVVWIGCDSQKFTLGNGQYGGTVAAPVWAAFMKETKAMRRKKKFASMPAEVVVSKICSYSGKKPTTGCSTKNEYFIHTTEPQETCTSTHQQMKSIYTLFNSEE